MVMINAKRRRLLQTVGVGAAGLAGLGAAGLTFAMAQRTTGGTAGSPAVRALLAGRDWLNTSPLAADDFKNKVVLLNFWTYSCINSLRALPYLAAWSQKYKSQGLVVIGVHTPEFAFEHDLDRVRQALLEQRVEYPVVLDNDYAIWNAFGNNAWPGFSFVDATGRLRHHAIGEGTYDESERWTQRLLIEAGNSSVDKSITDAVGAGAQAAPDWESMQTLETYVGYRKASNFMFRNGGLARDVPHHYEAAAVLPLNHWTLDGDWTIGAEFATHSASTGQIKLRFHARDLHLVLGRETETPAIRYRVVLDGQPPGDEHGVDTDSAGWGVLDQDRMYQLIRQRHAIKDREFAVTFLGSGVRVYVFTFG